ncbi:Nn.00g112440.m01.CDS01 [Neocucurbitaria sp. VM-36]
MPRRSSLAAPLPTSNSESRRRRSTDVRFDSSVSRPQTPTPNNSRTPGSSPYLPISIPSDEEAEEDTTPVRIKSNTNTSQSDTSPPRPSSAKVPRARQATTPNNSRTACERNVATDPGHLQSARLGTFDDGAIPYRRRRSAAEVVLEDDSGHHGNSVDNIDNDKDTNQDAKKKEKEKSAQLLHARLLEEARKKLTKEEEEGHVYIFRDPRKHGVLKIGRTKHVKNRRKSHLKCGLEVEWIHTSHPVKHMKRAEWLARIDLEHLSRPWKCSKCNQEHIEWFEVEEDKAKETVDLWVTWINEQHPYGNDKNLKPIWNYLLSHGRRPRTNIEHDDHTARWTHWVWVLSPPSTRDVRRFIEHNDHDEQDDDRTERILTQHRGNEEITMQHRPRIPTQQTAVTGPMALKDAVQAVKAAVDKGQNVNITINLSCNFTGDASTRRLL